MYLEKSFIHYRAHLQVNHCVGESAPHQKLHRQIVHSLNRRHKQIQWNWQANPILVRIGKFVGSEKLSETLICVQRLCRIDIIPVYTGPAVVHTLGCSL